MFPSRKWEVGPMTRHYLAGELSVLLGELQAAAPYPAFARYFADLRHEAETRPLTALGSVAVRALVLSDGLCWELLTRADAVAFARQAAISAQLHDFGVCAGLLPGEE
jgi:hypothetical protein